MAKQNFRHKIVTKSTKAAFLKMNNQIQFNIFFLMVE